MIIERILWGRRPDYADGEWIKITGGTEAHCKRELKYRLADGGWHALIIKKKGEAL